MDPDRENLLGSFESAERHGIDNVKYDLRCGAPGRLRSRPIFVWRPGLQ